MGYLTDPCCRCPSIGVLDWLCCGCMDKVVMEYGSGPYCSCTDIVVVGYCNRPYCTYTDVLVMEYGTGNAVAVGILWYR